MNSENPTDMPTAAPRGCNEVDALFFEAVLCAENELAQRQYKTDAKFRRDVQHLTNKTIDHYATRW